MIWTLRSSPFDRGVTYRGCWSDDLGLFVAVGDASGIDIATSLDGSSWTSRGVHLGGRGFDVVWANTLGLLVAVGNSIASSLDGTTWANHGDPFGQIGLAVAWSEAQTLLVAGGSARVGHPTDPVIATSPDGSSWTTQPSPFDGGQVLGVAYSPTLDLWVAAGYDLALTRAVMTSPDGVAWTAVSTSFDAGSANSALWAATLGAFVVTGNFGGGPQFLSSPDGTTWTTKATPFDASGPAYGALEIDADLFLGGAETGGVQMARSSDGGATWVADDTPEPFGFDGIVFGFGGYSPELGVAVALGEAGDGVTELIASSSAPPDPVLTHGEYRNTWRWVVTMLDGSTVKTFLDKLATNVQIAYVLNGDSQQVTLDVPSDSDEVNHLADELPGHGPTQHPRVSQNRRLLYGFRREEGAGLASPRSQPPWTCRWGGVITIVQDEAAEDVAVTHVTSHDGWTWAKSLPVLDPDGSPPDANGVTYEGKTAGYVAKDVIANAYAWIAATYPATLPWNDLPNDGQHLLIDVTNGRFDPTDVIPTINFAQGCSVGEAWTQLVATGAVDVVLEPVWGQPGVINVLNVRATVGRRRPNAIFGWGKFPKNLVAADNLLDGTQLANYAQYFAGQGAAPVATQDTSIDAYGPYWQIKSYPTPASIPAVALIAAADAALQKNGKQTVVIDPTPELAPDPFTQYFLGDEVSLVVGTTTKGGGSSFRSRFSGGLANKSHRVYGFQISLADDLTETVTNLLLSDPNAAV